MIRLRYAGNLRSQGEKSANHGWRLWHWPGRRTGFLRCGASVAVNDLADDRLTAVVDELAGAGHAVVAAPGDVGNPEQAPAMVAQAVAALGGLDYLVNNAGTPGTARPIATDDFERQDEDFWQLLVNVNLVGPHRCTRAAAEALRATGGAIVNTTSIAAFRGGGSSAVYCATKAGLVSLTREWARALAPQVRVNAIAPGLVDSGLDVPLRRAGTTRSAWGNLCRWRAPVPRPTTVRRFCFLPPARPT